MSNLFNLIRIEFGETLGEQEEDLTLNGFGKMFKHSAAAWSGIDVAGFAPTTIVDFAPSTIVDFTPTRIVDFAPLTSAASFNNSSLQRKESTIAEHLFAAHKAASKKCVLSSQITA